MIAVKVRKIVKENMVFVLCMIFLLLMARYVLSIAFSTGESMEPTITSPSILLINRLTKEYERNDIIACKMSGKKSIVKRIVGLPGESIVVTTDGLFFIDGVQYEDTYGNIEFPVFLDGDRDYPVILGENEYFVMGDNRNVSADSRFEEIGDISKEQIIGIVVNCQR